MVDILQTLTCIAKSIAALGVGVTSQPILPAGSSMSGCNGRIHVESITMLESDVALVDHLYIGPTTKNQEGRRCPKRLECR